MRRSHVLSFAIASCLALLLAACGSGDDRSGGDDPWGEGSVTVVGDTDIIPVLTTSEIVTGSGERFAFSLLDSDQNTIAAPDIDVEVEFFDLDESRTEPVKTQQARFLWTIPDERGMYSTQPAFEHAGAWGARFTATSDGEEQVAHVRFDVRDEPTGVAVGDPAPVSVTKTAADAGGDLAVISTDDDPDPGLYDLSVADAIAADKPFVVAFATPKFCTTATCGPTLDVLKNVKAESSDANFLHVEVFENLDTAEPTRVAAVDEWGLRTEPWVFVVDADGVVTNRFEGAVSADELESALDAVG